MMERQRAAEQKEREAAAARRAERERIASARKQAEQERIAQRAAEQKARSDAQKRKAEAKLADDAVEPELAEPQDSFAAAIHDVADVAMISNGPSITVGSP